MCGVCAMAGNSRQLRGCGSRAPGPRRCCARCAGLPGRVRPWRPACRGVPQPRPPEAAVLWPRPLSCAGRWRQSRRFPGLPGPPAAAARLLNYCDGLASTPSRPFVKNHVNKRPAKHGAKCGTPWPCPGRRGGRRSKSGDGGQDLLEHIAQISAALLSSKLLNHL